MLNYLTTNYSLSGMAHLKGGTFAVKIARATTETTHCVSTLSLTVKGRKHRGNMYVQKDYIMPKGPCVFKSKAVRCEGLDKFQCEISRTGVTGEHENLVDYY